MLEDLVVDQKIVKKKSELREHNIHNQLWDPVDLAVNEKNHSVERSPYLVKRLSETKEKNLFNHVKFKLVKQHIDALGVDEPKVVDIGCGLQVAKTYLSGLGLNYQYYGMDYEQQFKPDAVVDLLNLAEDPPVLPWKADVLLMLDVLEHLHEDPAELSIILSRLSRLCTADTTMIFTLPQMYRLDRFKLKHLHYPEHKIRLTQKEWVALIEKHFEVVSVQGFGYLSVLPYLPMASKRYKNDNRLGKLFQFLRGRFFEWPPFKPVDLCLSRLLGHIPFVNTFSNDILLVVRSRPKI